MSKQKKNTFNDFSGIMFSTDPDFVYESPKEEEQGTLANAQQDLRVMLDRKTGAENSDLGYWLCW